jgi:hypothetical protein
MLAVNSSHGQTWVQCFTLVTSERCRRAATLLFAIAIVCVAQYGLDLTYTTMMTGYLHTRKELRPVMAKNPCILPARVGRDSPRRPSNDNVTLHPLAICREPLLGNMSLPCIAGTTG